MILDELLAIPADATNATVQGVEMKVISNERAEMLLNNDAEDGKTHECILKNGRFLFESVNGELKSLYKVLYHKCVLWDALIVYRKIHLYFIPNALNAASTGSE